MNVNLQSATHRGKAGRLLFLEWLEVLLPSSRRRLGTRRFRGRLSLDGALGCPRQKEYQARTMALYQNLGQPEGYHPPSPRQYRRWGSRWEVVRTLWWEWWRNGRKKKLCRRRDATRFKRRSKSGQPRRPARMCLAVTVTIRGHYPESLRVKF